MMATEQEQVYNRALMWGLTVVGLTKGIWELVDSSAVALSPQIGAQMLSAIEAHIGRKVEQQDPVELLDAFARVFVDEMGFCSDFSLETAGNKIVITLKHAIGSPELASVKQSGVGKLFSHPFLCVCLAALARVGVKATGDVDIDPATHTQVVTFNLR